MLQSVDQSKAAEHLEVFSALWVSERAEGCEWSGEGKPLHENLSLQTPFETAQREFCF